MALTGRARRRRSAPPCRAGRSSSTSLMGPQPPRHAAPVKHALLSWPLPTLTGPSAGVCTVLDMNYCCIGSRGIMLCPCSGVQLRESCEFLGMHVTVGPCTLRAETFEFAIVGIEQAVGAMKCATLNTLSPHK